MAFHVFPDEADNRQDHPLALAEAAATGLITIGPLPAEGTAFIRIAWQPASGPDPSISLKADTGAETPIPIDDTTHAVFNRASGGVSAGDALLDPPVNGVYRLRIFLQSEATWSINIRNNDAVAHALVWVVADSDIESQQPWIHATGPEGAPATIAFETIVGQTASAQLEIANRGTGPLTVSGVTPDAPASFTISGLPVTLGPNEVTPATVKVDFVAPATAEDIAVSTHTLVTADGTDAGPFGAGHNNTLSLSAHVTDPPEPPEPPHPRSICRGLQANGLRCTCTGFLRGRGNNVRLPCARRGCGHTLAQHLTRRVPI